MLLVAIKTRPQITISHVAAFCRSSSHHRFGRTVTLFRCVKQQKFLILSLIFFCGYSSIREILKIVISFVLLFCFIKKKNIFFLSKGVCLRRIFLIETEQSREYRIIYW